MIQPKSFAGEGLSCIVNSRGDVIISPTDISPFMQLADIIDEGSDNHIKHQVEQLQDDLQKEMPAFCILPPPTVLQLSCPIIACILAIGYYWL